MLLYEFHPYSPEDAKDIILSKNLKFLYELEPSIASYSPEDLEDLLGLAVSLGTDCEALWVRGLLYLFTGRSELMNSESWSLLEASWRPDARVASRAIIPYLCWARWGRSEIAAPALQLLLSTYPKINAISTPARIQAYAEELAEFLHITLPHLARTPAKRNVPFASSLEEGHFKLVGLIRAKNEELTISQLIEKLLDVCDAIIVLDSGSTDRTTEKVAQSDLLGERVFLAKSESFDFHEGRDQNLLLSHARFLGATHVLQLDCDEILSSACFENANLRNSIKTLKKGDVLALPWISWLGDGVCEDPLSLLGKSALFRGEMFKDIAWADDGISIWDSKWIHTGPSPSKHSRRAVIRSDSIALLHLEKLSLENLKLKKDLYRVLEAKKSRGRVKAFQQPIGTYDIRSELRYLTNAQRKTSAVLPSGFHVDPFLQVQTWRTSAMREALEQDNRLEELIPFLYSYDGPAGTAQASSSIRKVVVRKSTWGSSLKGFFGRLAKRATFAVLEVVPVPSVDAIAFGGTPSQVLAIINRAGQVGQNIVVVSTPGLALRQGKLGQFTGVPIEAPILANPKKIRETKTALGTIKLMLSLRRQVPRRPKQIWIFKMFDPPEKLLIEGFPRAQIVLLDEGLKGYLERPVDRSQKLTRILARRSVQESALNRLVTFESDFSAKVPLPQYLSGLSEGVVRRKNHHNSQYAVPQGNRALLIGQGLEASRLASFEFESGLVLRSALFMRSLGYEVTFLPHPRDVDGKWSFFELADPSFHLREWGTPAEKVHFEEAFDLSCGFFSTALWKIWDQSPEQAFTFAGTRVSSGLYELLDQEHKTIYGRTQEYLPSVAILGTYSGRVKN